MLTLTVEQKCDIATRELDELREDRQKKRDESEKALDNHRVGLQQLKRNSMTSKRFSHSLASTLLHSSLH